MRTRPYLKLGIIQLEMLFESAREDPGTLRMLLHELRFRKTGRARQLRSRAAQRLEATKSGTSQSARVAGRDTTEPEAASSATPREAPSPLSNHSEPTGDPVFMHAEQAGQKTSSGGPVRTPGDGQPQHPDADSILAAWLTLEVLTPQPLPEVEDLRAMGRQLVRLEERPEPWTDPKSRKRGKERAVYWFLHLGEINLGKATQSLLRLFPDQEAEERVRARGTTTMAVTVLDDRGRPISTKTFLSSFAWGYGQVRKGALASLADFPEAELRIRSELERRLIRQDEDGEILPLTTEIIRATTAWLLDSLNLPDEEVAQEGLAVRVPVWRYAGEAPEPELLNSFFLEDLTRVRAAWRSGDVGSGLRKYLAAQQQHSRRDVVREQGCLEETLKPQRIPRARWPARGGYPLVLMQQAAVSHSVGELHEAGLVGINGPPGTGKTTLLRDVVAKVVLDRAIALARFDDPREAFSHVTTMRLGPAYTHLYQLDESLLGHEIVVASSNNKAVENISREIPAAEAVADDFDPPLRYFASIADSVAADGRDGEIVDGRAWGLAAAVLGNKANRSAFASSFWWHKERGMSAYLRGIVNGWPDAAPDDETQPAEVLLREDAPRSEAEALQRWQTVRRDFLSKLRRVDELTSKFEAAREALARRAESEAELRKGELTVTQAQSEVVGTRRAVDAATASLGRALRTEEEAVEDRAAVLELRPGFFARLFRTQPYRVWRDQMTSAHQMVEQARAVKRAAERECEAKRTALTGAEVRLRDAGEQLELRQRRHAAIEAAIDWAREVAGDRLPDEAFWAQAHSDLQKSSPWLAESLQEARGVLFEAAFDLHRAFVDGAARRLRHNLGAALAVMQGRSLTETQEPARRSLWASLFLVVPVISTTFASVSRLFGRLGREQLGWLLIDEAGQAVPQAAVGGMWRSQRVVAIGDPLQIEPVVTVPPRLISAIFKEFSVPAEEWAAPIMSVQTLADRVSWFGTKILQDEGDLWVGCPLRVHRRCDEPMFSISNRIAYGGLMVQATPPAESTLGDLLGESRWIDVDSEAVGKWSETEGRVAVEFLSQALAGGLDDPDLFFITPFRLVAQNLRAMVRSTPTLRDKLPEAPWTWSHERVGTIHTFQGKEAEAVVLVLGAPLDASVGARRWAGGSPNLLNVAVSRAKRRLYVVGSRRAWKEVGVFQTLAAALPRRDPEWDL